MIKILSKELKQIIKELKKEFTSELKNKVLKNKTELNDNKDLYDTKMIMFKTFGV